MKIIVVAFPLLCDNMYISYTLNYFYFISLYVIIINFFCCCCCCCVCERVCVHCLYHILS
ncbi:hypothetical protein [Plasmodium yoelii yoelii]|uniref:Uncharacterized protein n=1 Tax=Plasmodium yoelii yoelii TaxID=73239 RepID=Q7RBQ2_PLAYO|nr:hypothetical protein [Plasmodium yoelii yoelii]